MTKTILEKLGYAPGGPAAILGPPASLAALLKGVAQAKSGPAPFLLAFVESQAALEAAAPVILARGQRGGHIWIAYPKKTGAIKTDITRDHGWAPIVAADLLPVTQIAIDETWSALRFRYRDEIKRLTRKTDTPGG